MSATRDFTPTAFPVLCTEHGEWVETGTAHPYDSTCRVLHTSMQVLRLNNTKTYCYGGVTQEQPNQGARR